MPEELVTALVALAGFCAWAVVHFSGGRVSP